MNNLHRELAPISDAAWEQIEDQARSSFSARSAARRVVDVPEPAGPTFAAASTGHLRSIESPGSGIELHLREVSPVAQIRVPFTVTRVAIDDVERGSQDSDWQPVKDAAAKIAFAEDHTVFQGSATEQIHGIAPASTNQAVTLPGDVREYPGAVAHARSELRFADVEGPFTLLLAPELFTSVVETTDYGNPIREHIARILGADGEIVWAPAVQGALLVSRRGGDYTLQLGEDVSIGYLSHDADTVQLYLQESLTFMVNTAEASVPLHH